MQNGSNLNKRYKLIFFAQIFNLIGWVLFFILFVFLVNFLIPESFFPEEYIQENAATSFFPFFAFFLIPDILNVVFEVLGFLCFVFLLCTGTGFFWQIVSINVILNIYKKTIIRKNLTNDNLSVEELKLFKIKLNDFSLGITFIFIVLSFISILVLTNSIMITMILSPFLFSFYVMHKKIRFSELDFNKSDSLS